MDIQESPPRLVRPWLGCVVCLVVGCAAIPGPGSHATSMRAGARPGIVEGDAAPSQEARHGEPAAANELALFLGFTVDEERGRWHRGGGHDGGELTGGLDYERRLGPRWGIGALAHARGDVDEGLIGVPVYFHLPPGGPWTLVVAPVVRLGSRDEDLGLRLGVTYALPFGGARLEPGLFGDRFEHRETLVLGVGLTTGF